MAQYRLGRFGTVIRQTDNSSIPADPGNLDRQTYLNWLAQGNTPDPVIPDPIVFADRLQASGKVRTTAAAAVEIWRLTLAPTTGYAGDFVVIGVDAGNGAVRIVRVSVAVKRLAAGALGIGAPAVVVLANHADTGTTTWGGVAASLSGNDAIVTVAGLAGRTIDWSLSGQMTRFAPGGLP
jgi:hypothetical protein